jgi:CBS domain containing-hemolysin-like protein
METIRQIQKKYGSRAMATAVLTGFLLILVSQKPLGKGLILGTIFSVINFILMGQAIPLKAGKSRKQSVALSFLWIMIRYALLAVPLFVAIRFEQYNLFAVIAGIFMIQIMILGDNLFGMWSSRKNQA